MNYYVSNNSEICKKKEESLPIYLTFQSLSGPHTMQFMDMYNTFVFRKRLWKFFFFYDDLVLTIKAFSISYCRHSSSVKGEHGTQEETKEGEWGQGWEKMKRLAVL